MVACYGLDLNRLFRHKVSTLLYQEISEPKVVNGVLVHVLRRYVHGKIKGSVFMAKASSLELVIDF
jgi:hypothetical protein